MAQLKEITCRGLVTGCFLSPDRSRGLETEARRSIDLTLDGVVGDCHSGRTRKADARTLKQYPRGVAIFNSRQISLVSEEELTEVARLMDIDTIKPEWLGATIRVKSIPDFSLLPSGTRLMFSSGATVIVDLENHPCIYPAEVIEKHHPGKGLAFPKRAKHKRGVTAYVEYGGRITLDDEIRIFMPTQDAWPHRDRFLHA